MQVGYYPTRNFATIGLSWLEPSFTKASVQSFGHIAAAEPLPLTVWHRTGVGPYTLALAFAETCVFGKQSLPPFHCGPRMLVMLDAPHPRAPLLPKLQG